MLTDSKHNKENGHETNSKKITILSILILSLVFIQPVSAGGGCGIDASVINEKGQVAGRGQTSSGEFHAFLWKNGKAFDLGTLGGGTFSVATGINERGQVVGVARMASGEPHAFLWRRGVMIDLGAISVNK